MCTTQEQIFSGNSFYLKSADTGRCLTPTNTNTGCNSAHPKFQDGCSGNSKLFRALDKGGGNFLLRGVQMNICLHPASGQPNSNHDVITYCGNGDGSDGCEDDSRLYYKLVMRNDGSFLLKNPKYGFCVHPTNGYANAGRTIEFFNGCDTLKRLAFQAVFPSPPHCRP